jgi:hypothetical protein
MYPMFDGSKQDIETICGDVKSAIDLLHNEDFVFADLRTPNILAVKNLTGWHAVLVDFDWCGKHNNDKYPSCMNMNIKWPQGVEPHATLQKAHDSDFLGRIQDDFSKLF